MKRTFTITHEKTKVTIETEETKFDAIDNLIMALFRHYRDKKPERLDDFVKFINVTYECNKMIKERKERKVNKHTS